MLTFKHFSVIQKAQHWREVKKARIQLFIFRKSHLEISLNTGNRNKYNSKIRTMRIVNTFNLLKSDKRLTQYECLYHCGFIIYSFIYLISFAFFSLSRFLRINGIRIMMCLFITTHQQAI